VLLMRRSWPSLGAGGYGFALARRAATVGAAFRCPVAAAVNLSSPPSERARTLMVSSVGLALPPSMRLISACWMPDLADSCRWLSPRRLRSEDELCR